MHKTCQKLKDQNATGWWSAKTKGAQNSPAPCTHTNESVGPSEVCNKTWPEAYKPKCDRSVKLYDLKWENAASLCTHMDNSWSSFEKIRIMSSALQDARKVFLEPNTCWECWCPKVRYHTYFNGCPFWDLVSKSFQWMIIIRYYYA